MSKTPFMPLWVSDFLGDTLDLDAAEIGAYMLLLMAQWNRDGRSLPNDAEKLKRVARVGRNWPKVWDTISHYFETDEAGIYSARLRYEADSVAAKRIVNSHNGELGGRAKALKNNNAAVADANDPPRRNAGIPEPESYREKEEPNGSSKKQRGTRLEKGWVLPRTWGQWAVSEGWSDQHVRAESEKFRDYWHSVSGQKGVKLDWQATWRNWMRNSSTPPNNRNGPSTDLDALFASLSQQGAAQ